MKIKSPVTGSVIRISIAVGDSIKVEDEVAILESMKMEIPVVSEFSGTVTEILIRERMQVQEDEVLVVLR